MYNYQIPSKELVLAAINIENGLMDNPLTLDQIAMGIAMPVLTPTENRDTQLMLYALRGKGYSGTQTILYNRLNVATYFRNLTIVVIGEPVTKLSDALPALSEQYRILLEKGDIVDVAVTGDDWIQEVVINEGNVGWKGSFYLRYAKQIPALIDVVNTVSLNAIVAQYVPVAKPRAEYLAYAYDFTEIMDTLKTFGPNVAITQDLVDEVNNCVPLKLTFKPQAKAAPGEISLYGGTVAALATPTKESIYNTDYKKALVIRLPADSSYEGSLILHYEYGD